VSRRQVPILVGVGQTTQHVEDAAEGREPLSLGTEALRRALEDTGAGERVVAELDSLDVVNVISWQYDDLPGRLAAAVGASPSRTSHSDWGGDRPTLLLDRAAARIARGESRVAAVVGAEAIKSLELGLRGGRLPEWTPPPPGAAPPNPRDHVRPLAWDHGLRLPAEVYPLWENGLRSALGLDHEVNQQWSGWLWEQHSRMAAANPDAWDQALHTAEEITTAGPANRPVSHPYVKLMTARIAVNQSAAAIMMDAALADELAIPEDHRVSPLAGAGLADPDDVLARVAWDRSPSMETALAHALERAGVGIDDCDLLELYSCFPCVPKLAIRSLGLPERTDTSVTGGLTFFGGPGNDYMLHAVVAMVRALRAGDGTTGLLYGNGGFLTKHHALVVRAGTTDQPYAVDSATLDAELQAGIDDLRAPALATVANGPATIEAWTVVHDPDGTPATGIAVCRLRNGERTVANIVERIDGLLDGRDPVGTGGTIHRDSDRNILSLD